MAAVTVSNKSGHEPRRAIGSRSRCTTSTTAKEYVEFLRDRNTTNQAGNIPHGALFGLDRPSPHPFRGAGTLVYRLAERGAVDLAVYDVSGRRVRTLLGGETAPAGVHRILWDGRDDSGQAVASGLYFIRLESGGRRAVERLVLVK